MVCSSRKSYRQILEDNLDHWQEDCSVCGSMGPHWPITPKVEVHRKTTYDPGLFICQTEVSNRALSPHYRVTQFKLFLDICMYTFW